MCDSLHCLKCGRKDHSTGNHNAVIDEEQDAREKEKSTLQVTGRCAKRWQDSAGVFTVPST